MVTDFPEKKVYVAAVVVVQNTFLNLGTRLFKDLCVDFTRKTRKSPEAIEREEASESPKREEQYYDRPKRGKHHVLSN